MLTVSKITFIEVCVSNGSSRNPEINLTSPKVQPYVIPLPEGATERYIFIFNFYDVGNDVYRVEKTGEWYFVYGIVCAYLGWSVEQLSLS